MSSAVSKQLFHQFIFHSVTTVFVAKPIFLALYFSFLAVYILSGFFVVVVLFWGFFCFVFLVVLGFELRALCLLDRHSTTGAMPPTLFALIIFDIVSHFLSRLT
jgi:hypothetical protein